MTTPRAAGSITRKKLASGKVSWGYSFFAGRDEAGKRIQKTKGGYATRKAAQDALQEALAKHHAVAAGEPAPEPKKPVTYGELYGQWLEEKRQDPDVRQRTVEAYEKEGQRLFPALADTSVQDIDSERLEGILRALHRKGSPERPLSPKSLRNTRGVAYGVFQLAVKRGLIASNPVSGLKRAKSAVKIPKTLKPQEIALILQAAHGTDLFPVIALALHTGMRRGEVCGLHWTEIDFDSREILVKYAVDQVSTGLALKPPKNGNERVVPFGARTRWHHTFDLYARGRSFTKADDCDYRGEVRERFRRA